MNRSGLAVRRLLRRHRTAPEGLLVVCDTLDLPPGRLRLRAGGSSAGHNGLKSIISELGTSDFLRLYVGIGRPATRDGVVDYVLQSFSPEEATQLKKSISAAANAVEALSDRDFHEVVNEVNSRR